MKIRAASIGVSLDGYAAGAAQSLEQPLGRHGPELMEWFFPTRTWRQMQGQDGGETGVDDRMAAASFQDMGAWVIGRNMFGPVRGPWPDESWRGWWGDEPPYHVPVFVLTHHPRPVLRMQGGTEFHFVTDGFESALARAREAAGGKDVRIGGGASTIRQGLQSRALDELHVAVRPVLLGAGEPLWAGLDLRALGYAVDEVQQGERALHAIIRRREKNAP